MQNDFKMSLMAPEDLREYAGLTTTTITCKQRMTLSAAGIDLIRWALEGTFGKIDELPESRNNIKKLNGNGDTHMNGSGSEEEEADEEIANSITAYLVMGCVTVRYRDNGEVELEWEGNMLNDGIADAIMAVLFSVESSPAAVKRMLIISIPHTLMMFVIYTKVINKSQNLQANIPTHIHPPTPSPKPATSTPT